MYAPADPSRICRYCAHFDHWRNKDAMCGKYGKLIAMGMGCASFERSAGAAGDDDGRPRKPGEAP